MGNPDYIIIINLCALLIEGKRIGYDDPNGRSSREIALELAIKDWNKNLDDVDKLRKENPECCDPDYFRPEIESITIYIKSN
jgi:hypothetical protein